MWMVIREAAAVVALGAGMGGTLAVAASRVASTQLYGLVPHDPLTYVASIGLLSGVAMLAAYVPARRASCTEPTVALRHD